MLRKIRLVGWGGGRGLIEVNYSGASVQHKRTAAGRRLFIFRSFSICLSWGPIFRVLLMLRSVPYGRVSRLIRISCLEFRPVVFQGKSRSSQRHLPHAAPCWEKTSAFLIS